jgi:hypothetical protein
LYVEVDLGRVIGKAHCVRTKPGDEIVYAQRENRNGLTRFVRNGSPEDCRFVVVALRKVPSGYVLETAYIGRKAPAEPWDERYTTEESRPFWNTHALVWGSRKDRAGNRDIRVPMVVAPVCTLDIS